MSQAIAHMSSDYLDQHVHQSSLSAWESCWTVYFSHFVFDSVWKFRTKTSQISKAFVTHVWHLRSLSILYVAWMRIFHIAWNAPKIRHLWKILTLENLKIYRTCISHLHTCGLSVRILHRGMWQIQSVKYMDQQNALWRPGSNCWMCRLIQIFNWRKCNCVGFAMPQFTYWYTHKCA